MLGPPPLQEAATSSGSGRSCASSERNLVVHVLIARGSGARLVDMLALRLLILRLDAEGEGRGFSRRSFLALPSGYPILDTVDVEASREIGVGVLFLLLVLPDRAAIGIVEFSH